MLKLVQRDADIDYWLLLIITIIIIEACPTWWPCGCWAQPWQSAFPVTNILSRFCTRYVTKYQYRENLRLALWLRRSSNDSKWWRSSPAMLDIRLVVIINNMAAVIIIIIFIGMTIDQRYVTIVIVIFNWGWSDHLDSNPLGSKAPSTSLERGTHLWGTSLSRSQQVQHLWWRSCFSITQMEILHFAGPLLIWGTRMETFSA